MKPFYWFIWTLARLFFRYYGRVRIVGAANVPRSGGVIVAPNHVSYLDPPLVSTCITRECAFLAQAGLWRNRWLGRLITALNSIPVDRDKPDRASVRAALEALKHGNALVLFPEGTRSADGRLQPGEAGVALFVHRSGAPVVPVALIGPERMWPRGQKRLRRVRLTVVFGDAIYFTPDTPRAEVVAAIMRCIADLLRANGAEHMVAAGNGAGTAPGVAVSEAPPRTHRH